MTEIRTGKYGFEAVEEVMRRPYGEMPAGQALRELLVNAIQAGATRIKFGFEPNAYQRLGVLRLAVWDNGVGIPPEFTERYLTRYGGSSHDVGEDHGNLGIGGKVSTVPANPDGVVFATRHNREDSVLWLYPAGPREWDLDDGVSVRLDECYEEDIAWHELLPEHNDSGTVVVLRGSVEHPNTAVHGDANRAEEATPRFKSQYLQSRFWRLPPGVRVEVEEVVSEEPLAVESSIIVGLQDRINNANLDSHGTVTLTGSVQVHWFLLKEPTDDLPSGISLLYQDELFETRDHPQTFRAWGVPFAEIRQRLILVIEPPRMVEDSDADGYAAKIREWGALHDWDVEGRRGRLSHELEASYELATGVSRNAGVFTRQDRGSLLWRTVDTKSLEIPYAAWQQEWRNCLDDEAPLLAAAIARAADAATASSTTREELDRIGAKFGPRWNARSETGSGDVDRPEPGERKKIPPSDEPARNRTRRAVVKRHFSVGKVPTPVFRRAEDFDREYDLAQYVPAASPDVPGEVFINIDHPSVKREIDYACKHHRGYSKAAVASVVHEFFGRHAACKSGSILAQAGKVPQERLDAQLTPASLTAALGIGEAEDMQISALLKKRLG